jgi:5'-deoxynucleotidase YfbR-like HD superfamily hydrolase
MKIKENPQKVAAMQKEIEKLDKDIEARKARIDVQMKLLEKWREKEALTNKELDIVFEMTQLKLATIESEFERDALKQVSNGKYTKWEDLWLDKRKARIDEAKKEFFEITKRDYDQECLRK